MMKYLIIIILQLTVTSFSLNAQCPELLKNNNIGNMLSPYHFDGIFNCEPLKKSEGVVLYKTFFEGLRYKLKVISSKKEDKFIIEIFDLKNNLLFSNKNDKNLNSWNFAPEKSVQVVIFITLLESTDETSSVAMVTGFKENDDE